MAGRRPIREEIGSSATIDRRAGAADAIGEQGARVLREEARRERAGLVGATQLAEREDAGRRALFPELAVSVRRRLLVEEREGPRRVAVLEGAVGLAEPTDLGLERVGRGGLDGERGLRRLGLDGPRAPRRAWPVRARRSTRSLPGGGSAAAPTSRGGFGGSSALPSCGAGAGRAAGADVTIAEPSCALGASP